MRKISFIFMALILLSSCESAEEQKAREQQAEDLRKEKMAEKVLYDKYINNSLKNGSSPYAYCFGRNKTCSTNNCSQIEIKAPINSDVIVTVKKNNEVYRHAYISAGNEYSLDLPNGQYQTFFYYGKGWNPDKIMKETNCGVLKGGFISEEVFGKDDSQLLKNNILSYELIIQQNGNFSTKSSNSQEAF